MAKKLRLTTRDRLILEHIHQFNLSTPRILKGEYFEDKKMAAVDSTTRRLRKHGLITSHQIDGSRRVYYRLTPEGGRTINQDVKPDVFGCFKFFRSYAMLHFICLRSPSVERVKCSPTMLSRLIVDNGMQFPRIDFYMAENKHQRDNSLTTSLGMAIADMRSKHRRLVQRCVKHSRNFIQRGWFVDVMKAGRFEITVLTGSESKKKDLELSVPRELRRQLRRDILKHGLESPIRFPIKFKVEVIPELDEIVPFRKKREK